MRKAQTYPTGYNVWRGMRQRCNNPNATGYKHYGGRGIRVCPAWQESFAAFWADMGPTFIQGLEIDRKDNNGDYSFTNCRWVTHAVNTANRRDTREADLKELNRTTGISCSTLAGRYRKGVRGAALTNSTDAHRIPVDLKAMSLAVGVPYPTLRRRYKAGLEGAELIAVTLVCDPTYRRLKKISADTGVQFGTIKARYLHGWAPEKLSAPARPRIPINLKALSIATGIKYDTLHGRYRKGKRGEELVKHVCSKWP